jgi:diaminohydroxyphosphoribosylaminopyrimidine deaminase/5-amino-6-(5-phosphoribosylamino)uracil reductase
MKPKGSRRQDEDKRFMERALTLARRGIGRVSPNPMVGAVLVRNGRIIGEGFHRAYGGPHAEVNCIRQAKGNLLHSTMYVNLEPCSHFGNTPPCVDRIIDAGIQRVVIATKDPNPLVAGRGIRRLRAAGIMVRSGVLRGQATELNRFFFKHITTGIPYVHMKVAASLDGFIGRDGTSARLSSSPALRMVHSWRSMYDAVLVGAGTIRTDNPRLTTRLVPGQDPQVVILDGKFSLPVSARVFETARRRQVLVCTDGSFLKSQERKARILASKGVMLLSFPGKHGVVDLRKILRELSSRGIGSVLVEGGSRIFSSFLRAGLLDELSTFVTPFLLGRGVPAFAPSRDSRRVSRPFAKIAAKRVGSDFVTTFRFR